MLKHYSFFLIVFLCVLGIFAQNTVINDPNFEQALIDLGYDSDNTVNGTVLTSDISSRTSLFVPNKNISDLTGIEDFTSLTSLTCHSNQLTTLDLTNNTALTYLQCFNNLLTSVDVTQNTALTFLNFNFNQLTTIDISNNTLITNLGLANNQLNSLDITNNTALFYVQCQGNQIPDLDLSQNTALSNLVCGNNLYTNLDITNNTALTILNCSNSLISDLDTSHNPLLSVLYCSNNSLITQLDLSNNLELSILDCSNMPILNTVDLTYNTKLTELWCYRVPWTTLNLTQNTSLSLFYGPETPFTSLDFSNNTALTVLNCSYNQQLITLNVKSGNNTALTSLDARGCLNLECIQVDDETAANSGETPYTNWLTVSTTVYAEDCSALSVEDLNMDSAVRLYPNPVENKVYIDSELPLVKVEIFTVTGKTVKTISSGFESISMAHLFNGLYIVKLSSDTGFVIKKLIKY